MLNRLARLRGLRRLRRGPARPASARDADADSEQAFFCVARQSFVQLQAVLNRADLSVWGRFTTRPLLDELRQQLQLRGPGLHRTQVLELQARLVTIEVARKVCLASIDFSGWIREQVDDVAAPFRELWLLADVKTASSGWKLARVQALS